MSSLTMLKPVAIVLIIHGTVAPGEAFDAVMKVDQDLPQRDAAGQHDLEPSRVSGVHEQASLLSN